MYDVSIRATAGVAAVVNDIAAGAEFSVTTDVPFWRAPATDAGASTMAVPIAANPKVATMRLIRLNRGCGPLPISN